MNTIYLLIIRHIKVQGIMLETAEEQFLVFDEKEVMENWLRNNGFVYGHSDIFKNTPGEFYWFHQKDTAWDRVEVKIHEQTVADENMETEGWIASLMYRNPCMYSRHVQLRVNTK